MQDLATDRRLSGSKNLTTSSSAAPVYLNMGAVALTKLLHLLLGKELTLHVSVTYIYGSVLQLTKDLW